MTQPIARATTLHTLQIGTLGDAPDWESQPVPAHIAQQMLADALNDDWLQHIDNTHNTQPGDDCTPQPGCDDCAAFETAIEHMHEHNTSAVTINDTHYSISERHTS